MPEIARRNMKPRQGVGQPVGGQIAQEAVKPAQGRADFLGVPEILDGIKGHGGVNEAQCPPERPAGVNDVVPALPGQEHPGHLKAAAGGKGRQGQTTLHMAGHDGKVSHDQFRLREHPEVEALQNKVRFCRSRHRHQEGVIDIAVAVFPEVPDLTLEGELPEPRPSVDSRFGPLPREIFIIGGTGVPPVFGAGCGIAQQVISVHLTPASPHVSSKPPAPQNPG